MDRQTGRWVKKWTNRWISGWMDGWMMDIWVDRQAVWVEGS